MKKILGIVLIFWVTIFSCAQPEEKIDRPIFDIGYGHHVNVVVVDSCEYLYGPWGNATVLTHKGNCKNHKN